ncbi:zinc-dependent metalloprotease [Aulosira sp. FACHB-615]|uniref:zinc-dependent metalloprotease n=1 Tax=Aulosira sp. FACHB-615 TaxID=2692777 RepID=UPI0016864E9F|nr:zinc-dependent metalloprotease [Aulosira sp. FACHB-615]MBD2487101.1 zinc-dependent metalloprotease [Aulosira sp. FACHB-615]
MKHWIAKLAICIIFLYNFFCNNSWAIANQLSEPNPQEINSIPGVENLVDTSDFGEKKPAETQPSQPIEKGIIKQAGLFTTYQDTESGKVYLAIKPEQLNKSYLATITLESGIGESGIYSGLPLADFLFYWRRVKDNLHFVVQNVKFRIKSGEAEQRSLTRSFSDSVLYSVAIDSIEPSTNSLVIDLEELLMQDFSGLAPLLKYYLQAEYHFDKTKSYFGDVQSFLDNVEIDSIYGFSSPEGANLTTLPDSRALSLKVHYSFSQLPENNGYIPRIADDRVGYFITAFQDFSPDHLQEPFVRYINRWHLEPSDPNAPLSPPKKPIVFWIENAVPPIYRDAIREGVLMWNKAFEKAGFQNAVEVRQMPDDAEWHPADVRYNTIRWFNSLDAGFARGPMRVNPLTGEILDADIIVDANMVRSVQQEYHALIEASSMCQGEGSGSATLTNRGQGAGGRGAGETRGTRETRETRKIRERSFYLVFPHSPLPTPHSQDTETCYGTESTEQVAMGALALSLLQNTKPNSEMMKEYVHQYLRSVIAHEVGHTLGLRHNFHGSTMLAPQELNNPEITQSKGLTGSVMDYLPVNIAPQGVPQGEYFPSVVGPYDEWAIAYGYKKLPDVEGEIVTPETEKSFLEAIALASPQPELSYATDEDIRDINPLANVWDISSDVLVYSQWQMDNARVMWQRLDEGYLPKGESYSSLRVLFNRVLRYYFRNASLLSQYIGGQSFRRLHAGDEISWAFVPVSLTQQRQALAKLQEYVFAEDAFSFSPQLLNQLAPSRWQHWGSPIHHTRLDYPIHDRILSFQSAILRSLLDSDRINRLRDVELKAQPGQALSLPELFDTLQTGIWTEIFTPEPPKSISSIRRSLQQEHLNILLEMLLKTHDELEDSRTLAWYELRQLQTAIDSKLKEFGETLDIYTIAHLEFAGDRISKALNSQLLSKSY